MALRGSAEASRFGGAEAALHAHVGLEATPPSHPDEFRYEVTLDEGQTLSLGEVRSRPAAAADRRRDGQRVHRLELAVARPNLGSSNFRRPAPVSPRRGARVCTSDRPCRRPCRAFAAVGHLDRRRRGDLRSPAHGAHAYAGQVVTYLVVAAHPDDPDFGVAGQRLAWLARDTPFTMSCAPAATRGATIRRFRRRS